MNNEEQILVRVPAKLKKEFKIICLQYDTTMTDVLKTYIEMYVDKYKK